jgi:cathepsin L
LHFKKLFQSFYFYSYNKDWRTVWTKAATNQGVCGSCWAFATAAVAEAALKIKKGVDVDLSEQELVDCSGSLGNNACGGGVPLYGLEYVYSKGLNSEAAYPYHDATHRTAVKFTFLTF